MTEVKLGGATVQRIEEILRAQLRRQDVLSGLGARRGARASRLAAAQRTTTKPSGFLKLSVHSWLLKVGGKTHPDRHLRRQPQVRGRIGPSGT